MADVTNELIYEVLKQLQDRMGSFDRKLDEVKGELQALRIHSVAVQQDIQNIYSVFVRHDGRLERIERRLEIAETVS
jgi:DNA repair ATPase RecN